MRSLQGRWGWSLRGREWGSIGWWVLDEICWKGKGDQNNRVVRWDGNELCWDHPYLMEKPAGVVGDAKS
eukprot:176148-Hanusia_phi.AAC.7